MERAFLNAAIGVGFFAAIGYAVDYSFQLVDIFWVARIGAGAPTAIAVVSSLLFLVLSLNEIVGVSSVAIFSRRYGAHKVRDTEEAIAQTLVLKLLLGIFSALFFIFIIYWLLPFYGLSEKEYNYTINYTNIIWISIVLVPVYSSMMTALRTIGEASRTALISLGALIVNAGCNPLFIFGFGPFPALGIAGAAWATILAQLAAMTGCGFALARNRSGIRVFRRGVLRWDRTLIRDLFVLGLPIAGVMFLYNAEQALVTNIVAVFPEKISDGYGIGARISGFLFMMIFGVALGIAVTVGQYLARNQIEIIRNAMKRLMGYVVGALSLIALILALSATAVMTAFTAEPETIRSGAVFLSFIGVANIGLGVLYCYNGVFEGAGRNVPPLIAACIMYVCFEFPVLWLVSSLDGVRLWSIWLIVVSASWTGAFSILYLYRSGQWYTHPSQGR